MQGGNVTSNTDLSAEELELFAYLLEEEGIDDSDQRLIAARVGGKCGWRVWDPGDSRGMAISWLWRQCLAC